MIKKEPPEFGGIRWMPSRFWWLLCTIAIIFARAVQIVPFWSGYLEYAASGYRGLE